VNQTICDFEISLESKSERMQAKIKQAAINRGMQLLTVRQTAEKMRKLRQANMTPVSFEIEVEKNPAKQSNPLQQRLEAREVHEVTIDQICEKLA
jgi:hypothetical protein